MRAWIAAGVVMVVGGVIAGLVLRAPGDARHASAPVAAPVVDGAALLGSDDDTAAYHASQLVADAGREVTAGRFARAHALLEQAYAQDPRAATLLQLARVEDQLGRCRDAKRTAQRVLAVSPTGALAEQATQLLGRLGRCD
ncbi:MAG: tetratricopeptide repeat protein [Kofleriaceae bacterium]